MEEGFRIFSSIFFLMTFSEQSSLDDTSDGCRDHARGVVFNSSSYEVHRHITNMSVFWLALISQLSVVSAKSQSFFWVTNEE